MNQAVTIAISLVSVLKGATHVDVIDPGTEYQIIDNFGASDCWSMQKTGTWSKQSRQRVSDLLFSTTRGIGLSCWRVNLGGGICPRIGNPWRTVETFEVAEGRYDWSRQAPERWFLRAAKQRGVRQFVAFVNSPPARMTRNGQTNCDPGVHSTNLKPGYEKQFARYLVDVLRHFRDHPDPAERIEFDRISPVNEPGWEWDSTGQEGNRAGLDDIKAIVKALHAELARQKVKTRILVPEARSPSIIHRRARRRNREAPERIGDYLRELCGDPEVGPMLSGTICYHSYLADRFETQLVQQRQLLGRAMARYSGWKLWQTEYCVMRGPHGKGGGGRDLGIDTALNVARVIHYDLTLAGVSAWQWWLALSPSDYKDGLVYTTYPKPGQPETVRESKLLWALGNFSRFIRPGMRRIELTGDGHDKSGLLGSAYIDPKTGRVVAVYINMGDQPQEVRLRILARKSAATRPRRLTSHVTSDKPDHDLKRYPDVSLRDPYLVPGRAVVTLVIE